MPGRSTAAPLGVDTHRRPAPLAALNWLGRAARRVGVRPPPWREERLVAAARRGAKLSDLGTDEHVAPMRVLLGALEREADLNLFGWLAARSQVVTLLANRLKMQDWWTRHPEMLSVPVAAPWFVVGLPRSGTTLVQQLLACDPANRSLRFWEATRPAPPPERATYDSDPRIAAARRAQRMLDYVAPDANAIHPVGAQLPTECVSLLAHSFASLEFGVINHVPSHVRWCLDADWRPHYEYFRRQLQLLQWRCRGVRWTLKSPAHLVALDALVDAFPDARIVWLHRDPVTAVTSHCSLVAVLQTIGSDRVDLRAIGAEWPATWAEALARAIRARDRLGDERFVDVWYDELVADPLATVRRVYAAAGATLDEAAADRMRAHVAQNPQHRRGRHEYDAGSFGIDADAMSVGLSTYRARFSV